MDMRLIGATALSLALVAGTASAQSKLGMQCTVDAQCQDESFCNGTERCNGTCIPAPQPGCMANARCDEAADRCIVQRTDADGDGHASLATGGDDCDDYDRARFPGNEERWDDADHDEDCRELTHGVPSAFGVVGVGSRGQACSGEAVVVLVRSEHNDAFTSVPCGTGMACSGPGVCVAKDAAYVAPPAFAVPTGAQAAPSRQAPQQAVAMPAVAMPGLMAPRKTTKPVVAPAAKAPVAVPTATSKIACPVGQAFSAAVGKCIPIPPL